MLFPLLAPPPVRHPWCPCCTDICGEAKPAECGGPSYTPYLGMNPKFFPCTAPWTKRVSFRMTPSWALCKYCVTMPRGATDSTTLCSTSASEICGGMHEHTPPPALSSSCTTVTYLCRVVVSCQDSQLLAPVLEGVGAAHGVDVQVSQPVHNRVLTCQHPVKTACDSKKGDGAV